MNDHPANLALRRGARALTGVLIIGVAATVALILGSTPLPAIEHPPIALTVDTQQGAERKFVCPGDFAVLGADPAQPDLAIPTGQAQIVTAGTADAEAELDREAPGAQDPAVFSVSSDRSFAAAQAQSVATETLSGTTATSCAEPANEQWLVGGTTVLGATSTVSIGNPGGVPATVRLTLFDEDGQVDSSQTSSVLVPAGSERVVSLNGYAPDRERLAVRVASTGAAVTAVLEVNHVSGLQPFAVDSVTRQLVPHEQLVFPGVSNAKHDVHGPGDAGDADEFPVLVRLLSASGELGTAQVSARSADGTSVDLGTVDLVASAVAELSVTAWPEDATAVVVDATVPVVGGVLGSVDSHDGHDYAWFTPAPTLAAGAETVAAVVPGGQLVLANLGDTDAAVELAEVAADSDDSASSGKSPAPKKATVPAGGTLMLKVGAAVQITSDAPVHASVVVPLGAGFAAYPVLGEAERSSTLTVYPR